MPTSSKLRQKYHQFESSQGYPMRPCSKKTNKIKQQKSSSRENGNDLVFFLPYAFLVLISHLYPEEIVQSCGENPHPCLFFILKLLL